MSTVKIEKIKLTIAGQDVEMTLEQARELRAILNELWPEPTERLVPMPQPYPVAPYQPPIIIERWPEYPWWQQPIITCQSGQQTLCIAAK